MGTGGFGMTKFVSASSCVGRWRATEGACMHGDGETMKRMMMRSWGEKVEWSGFERYFRLCLCGGVGGAAAYMSNAG